MQQKRPKIDIHGWLAIDKPLGMTSTQVVGKVKFLTRAKKVGHGGTLDPLATGILPIGLGEATKTMSYAIENLKTYRFTVTWGEERSTDDLEGEVTATSEKRPSREEIEALLPRFMGEIEQVPPRFSAIKIQGARAYDLARAGEEVELTPRTVWIEELKILNPLPLGEGRGRAGAADEAASPHPGLRHAFSQGERGGKGERVAQTEFECLCGKGTYVRALARDMGRILGCYGHISVLRRTKVGHFSENNAISLEKLEELVHNAALFEAILPVETSLDDILALSFGYGPAERLRRGQPVRLTDRNLILTGNMPAYAHSEGKVVAIGCVEEGMFTPDRVFNY